MNTHLPTYYAKRAGEYERIYDKPERQADIAKLRSVLSNAFKGQEVLDVACGMGFWTTAFAPTAKSVVGCDINDAVLELAREKPWSGAEVSFVKADCFALPDFGKKFDGAFSGFWWSHVPRSKLSDFLDGLHRRLNPGAKVIFVDNRYVPGSSTPLCRTAPDGDTYQLRKLKDGSSHEVLKNFPSEDELLRDVSDCADRASVEILEYFWILTYYLRQSGMAQQAS